MPHVVLGLVSGLAFFSGCMARHYSSWLKQWVFIVARLRMLERWAGSQGCVCICSRILATVPAEGLQNHFPLGNVVSTFQPFLFYNIVKLYLFIFV